MESSKDSQLQTKRFIASSSIFFMLVNLGHWVRTPQQQGG